MVRDLSIGLRTSNHLRRSPEMLRQPPVAARVRVSATIILEANEFPAGGSDLLDPAALCQIIITAKS